MAAESSPQTSTAIQQAETVAPVPVGEPDLGEDVAIADAAGLALGLPPLRERTFLITGSTAGIGKVTAERLVKQGCTVIMHSRTDRKLEEIFKAWVNKHPGAKLDGYVADLSDMLDVQNLAEMISERHPVIHGILHNAATMDGQLTGKKVMVHGGFENTIAVNTMAPFLLTSLLLPNVWESGAGRIIFSGARLLDAGRWLDDLYFDRRWTGNHAYVLSKLCGVMMTAEMHHRYGDAPRLCFHSIDPGIANTKLMRHGASWAGGARVDRSRQQMRSIFPNARWATASYLSLTQNAYQQESGSTLRAAPAEVLDEAKRAKLWDDLVRMTKADWPNPAGLE